MPDGSRHFQYISTLQMNVQNKQRDLMKTKRSAGFGWLIHHILILKICFLISLESHELNITTYRMNYLKQTWGKILFCLETLPLQISAHKVIFIH